MILIRWIIDQRVKASCIGKNAPDGIRVLPFDLTSENEDLQSVVNRAWGAFNEIDYVVNNAGELLSRFSHIDWDYN